MILVLSEEKSLKLKKTAILVRNQARILTAIGMLKTKLCWWLYGGDSSKVLVAESFCIFNVSTKYVL